MKQIRFGGYTIVEVMIVLTISMVFFVASVSLFVNQSTHVSFDQSVQDAVSNISTQFNDVGSSQLLNDNGYTCTVSGNPPRATLSSTASTSLGNQDCLIIGTVIEAIKNSTTLYSYKVLGNRQSYNSAGGSIGVSSTLDQANPTIAITSGASLTSSYKFNFDLKILSSKTSDSSGSTSDNSLVGIYQNFNGTVSASPNGGQSVSEVAYNYAITSHDSNSVKQCIEKSICSAPTNPVKWALCIQNDKGDRTAEIDVSVNASGASVSAQYITCS